MHWQYIILGLLAGVFSGFLGLGGGVVVVPALVYIMGYTQHQAQGTTLAMMIPPIGLLAAMRYYYSGNVKIIPAAILCIGFFVGGLLGAILVQKIPDLVLKRAFGAFLFFISLKMMIGR
ncbi:MAG: sulfite exporter TauE/SafE family protein [Candidatus Omnitrophota bacterium]